MIDMQNMDDKDLAMIGVMILCIVGGAYLLAAGAATIAIGAIFASGITGLTALATGRKNGK